MANRAELLAPVSLAFPGTTPFREGHLVSGLLERLQIALSADGSGAVSHGRIEV